MCMTPRNIDIDDALVAGEMRDHGRTTKSGTVDLALRRPVGPRLSPAFLASLEGIGWDGDLDGMRDAAGASKP